MSRPLATESVYRAIGHPARRAILDRLRTGEHTVSEIHEALAKLGSAALSNHLRLLRESGLIRQRRRGTFRVYSLESRGLGDVAQWLRPFTR